MIKPRHCIASALVFSAFAVALQAQAPVSLQEQLSAQYRVVKLANDSSGVVVVEPGTLLTLQKGGILGVLPNSMVICPAKFQDGTLHNPGNFCAGMVKNNSAYFQIGQKVYVRKIEVNLKNDRVVFDLFACDSCNQTNPPTNLKSQVNFQFAKGALASASAGQVEDAIAQVFSMGDDSQPQPAQTQPQAAPVQASSPAQAQSQTQIQLGEPIDQVQSALGAPEKVVNLGSKVIYVYKDLKVTFIDGKVADVQ